MRTMCMVPIIDLANHKTPRLRTGADEPMPLEPVSIQADSIVLVAPTDLQAGQEVHITYWYAHVSP